MAVDAVGREEHTAGHAGDGGRLTIRALGEVGGDAGIVLGVGGESVVEVDSVVAQPVFDSVEQEHLKLASVDRQLWDVITGVEAARL